MEKFYDKILFGLAVTLLVIGVLMYFTGLQSKKSPAQKVVNDSPYASTPTTPLDLDTFSWPPAESQPTGPEWVYQVFTPPQIWLDNTTGTFVPRPIELPPLEEFRLQLVSVREPLFRYQFESYLEVNNEYILNIKDTKTGKNIRTKPGGSLEDMKISNFEIVRKEISGTELVDRIPTLTVLDEKENEIRFLIAGQPYTLNRTEVVLKHASGKEVILTKEGEGFTVERDSYRLETIDISGKKVTLTREYTDAEGNERSDEKTLSL